MAVVIALFIAAGAAIGSAIQVRPSGVLAGCRTASRLGPHLFSGAPAMCINQSKTYIAKVNTTHGRIDIAMPAKDAPKTVNNFVVLAANGYFNGLTFWKVQDWNVQGGDPLGNGRGGPGYSLPDERNNTTWGQGSVGMARPPEGPVNGSQFFILKTQWPGAGPGEGVYNHFGTVLGGVELVNTIVAGDRILSIDLSVQ
ncbi:MAG: peptidylprolyl isomerase [Candidatus Dormibacteraceae bacterium]